MTVEELRPLDRTFHAAIAAAAGNPLLGELHVKVLDAVFSSDRYDGLLNDATSVRDHDQVLAESRATHTAIARAIADRDPDAGCRRCPQPPRRRRASPHPLNARETRRRAGS